MKRDLLMAVTDFQKIKVYVVLLKVWIGYKILEELLANIS